MQPSLQRIFTEATLESYFELACEFCQELGLASMGALQLHLDELIQELALRPLEKKRLIKALDAAIAEQRATAATQQALRMKVQNTFITLDDREADLTSMRRLFSEPPVGLQSEFANPEQESDDDNSEPGVEVDTNTCVSGEGEGVLYKTVTDLDGYPCTTIFDGQASSTRWGWAPEDDDENEVEVDAQLTAHELACQQALQQQWLAAYYQGIPVLPCHPVVATWPPLDTVMEDAQSAEAPHASEARFVAVADDHDRAQEVEGQDLLAAEVQDLQKHVGLRHTFSIGSGAYRVRWVVDARKLKSWDREAASPVFELSFAGSVPFRIILHPRSLNDNKGGSSFKKSQGKGYVELRCLSSVESLTRPVVTFLVSAGSSGARRFQRPRGPVTHDFAERPICGLPPGRDEWDFRRAVHKPSRTFEVCLEFTSGGA